MDVWLLPEPPSRSVGVMIFITHGIRCHEVHMEESNDPTSFEDPSFASDGFESAMRPQSQPH